MMSTTLKTQDPLYSIEGTHSREDGHRLSRHATTRMQTRRIAIEGIQAALIYGRVVHVRGAMVYALGRNEVQRFSSWGVDLSPHTGLQVVCVGRTILTVYRNHDFRGLRRKKWHGRGSKKAWKYAGSLWPGSLN